MEKFTVITIVKDSVGTISRAIESVLAQNIDDTVSIEYIVMDGDSSDGTVDVIQAYGDSIDVFISEPDDGATHALNKALSLVGGDYVFFLNADDWIPSNFVMKSILFLRENQECDFVYGDLNFHDGQVVKYLKRSCSDYKKIQSTMSLYIPSTVFKRKIFENNLFDLSYSVAPDYEFFLRLYKAGFKALYVEGLYADFQAGGNSFNQAVKGFKEVYRASTYYGCSKFVAFLVYANSVIRLRIRRLLGRA